MNAETLNRCGRRSTSLPTSTCWCRPCTNGVASARVLRAVASDAICATSRPPSAPGSPRSTTTAWRDSAAVPSAYGSAHPSCPAPAGSTPCAATETRTSGCRSVSPSVRDVASRRWPQKSRSVSVAMARGPVSGEPSGGPSIGEAAGVRAGPAMAVVDDVGPVLGADGGLVLPTGAYGGSVGLSVAETAVAVALASSERLAGEGGGVVRARCALRRVRTCLGVRPKKMASFSALRFLFNSASAPARVSSAAASACSASSAMVRICR